MEINNRLKVLRAERNWTQKNLAEKMSISRQTVNAIENKKYNPSLSLAFRFARLFNCRIEDIFLFEEKKD